MKGTYSLLIQMKEPADIIVGSLGEITFKEGAYAYIGSGLRNLEKRIERHLAEEKNLHWHIDYLLTAAEIKEVWYGESIEKKECKVVRKLAEEFATITGFGSSDCKCESHLFYSPKTYNLRENIISSLREVGLEPVRWKDGKKMARRT